MHRILHFEGGAPLVSADMFVLLMSCTILIGIYLSLHLGTWYRLIGVIVPDGVRQSPLASAVLVDRMP
jgi:hypothetical protein